MPKSRLIVFILGILVGVLATLAVWQWGSMRAVIFPTNTPTSTTTPGVQYPQSGDVSVHDQPAGSSVLVDSVTVPPPGVWVAVEELNTDGTLGNVLGAALARGPRSDLSIPLLRSTEPDMSYAIVLYRDDGANAFDLSAESVYVDFDTGVRVVVPFKTTP